METALVIAVLFFSIILHEVSHGVVAYWNGDPTAKNAGRLTLNPLPHVDPLGTVVLPALLALTHAGVLLGWAKPVPFNPINFRNRAVGTFTVGVAGPVTNLVLAAVFALALRAVGNVNLLSPLLYYGVSINVFLAVFNMIPIPPLDGSRAVYVFLPRGARRVYASLERWGFAIIIVLLYLGVLGRIVLPVHSAIFRFLMGAP